MEEGADDDETIDNSPKNSFRASNLGAGAEEEDINIVIVFGVFEDDDDDFDDKDFDDEEWAEAAPSVMAGPSRDRGTLEEAVFGMALSFGCFGLNALGFRSSTFTIASLRMRSFSMLLKQPLQLQAELQYAPEAKQSQYNIRHFDLAQLHVLKPPTVFDAEVPLLSGRDDPRCGAGDRDDLKDWTWTGGGMCGSKSV